MFWRRAKHVFIALSDLFKLSQFLGPCMAGAGQTAHIEEIILHNKLNKLGT